MNDNWQLSYVLVALELLGEMILLITFAVVVFAPIMKFVIFPLIGWVSGRRHEP